MIIAIHNSPGSFSDRWILYCKEHNISYTLVDCYSSNIIEQCKDLDGLMWHWHQEDYRAQNFTRQLIFSLEKAGLKVFPNYDSCWHFDDKVGQKYLLEAIQAPIVPTYTFYNKAEAIKWLEKSKFPIVFKLRGGAGSLNVKLIKNKNSAKKVVRKAFNKGFPLVDKISGFKQRIWMLRRDRNFNALIHVLKGLLRFIFPIEGVGLLQRQKGYVYFQDFIQKNEFDDRIVVIGEKAIAIRRYNRPNDFRASGSGLITYNPLQFNRKALAIAFDVASQIKSQSLAFDFLYDEMDNPLIVEISYGYAMGAAYDNCPGYWDKDLNWHESDINPQNFIIEDFINSLQ